MAFTKTGVGQSLGIVTPGVKTGTKTAETQPAPEPKPQTTESK